MDVFEFIAVVIGSLAWPVAVVILVLLLLKPIKELIVQMQSFRAAGFGGGIEAEFARGAEGVQKQIREAEEAGIVSIEAPVGESAVERFSALAEVSPRGAVLEAWMMLENDLKEASVETAPPNLHNTNIIARGLVDANKLPLFVVPWISDLSVLRNRAVHATDADLSRKIVRNFLSSVDYVRGLIQRDEG